MEENKNDIDELVKSIDSSFKEMSLKDIVATHEEYFGAASLTDNEKKEEKPQKQPVKKKPERVSRTKDENAGMKKKVFKPEKKPVQAHLKERENDNKAEKPVGVADTDRKKIKALNDREIKNVVEKEKKPEISPEVKEQKKNERIEKIGKAGGWFQTICYMNIPIIGFIYVLVLAFSKKTSEERKDFARGYLIYKVLVWILAIVLLYCLYKIGLGFVDGMLSFIKA